MTSYHLHEVKNHSQLKKWIHFQNQLYQNTQMYVPPLLREEIAIFSEENPAREISTSRLFYVTNEKGKTVGRICCIIHHKEEEKLGFRKGRFGWFESIHNEDVAFLLLDAARKWFRSEGCIEMSGPHGYTDFDSEGLLVDGFLELPPISAAFHLPYYQVFFESFGLEKEVDYIEHRLKLPEDEPSLIQRVRKRYEGKIPYKVFTCTSRKQFSSLAPGFWKALESAFEPLYGVTPLTDKQKEFYATRYLNYLDPELVHLAVDLKEEVVGFFITTPSLSRAFQKAKGRLFPFGLFHILKESKNTDTMDLLIAGVAPGHPSQILIALLAGQVYQSCKKRGIRYIETNRELETNTKVTQIWKGFDSKLHRRSRIYKLSLNP